MTMDGKPQHPLIFTSLGVIILAMVVGVGGETAYEYPISKPGCPHKCGNVSIPYPFGTKDGCYLSENFLITCNDRGYNPPRAFLGTGVLQITEIMLFSGEFRSWGWLAHQCFHRNGSLSPQETNLTPWFNLKKFTLSYSKNKFVAVGCDVVAYLRGPRNGSKKFRTGCMTSCERIGDVINGSCTGIGCCQVSIPKRTKGVFITLGSGNNHSEVWSFDRCSYAFVVEENEYNFSSADFNHLITVERFPLIVDWTTGYETCEEAKQNPASYACGENSECRDYDDAPGYRCSCSNGYQGNPYLPYPNGCKDIDECTMYHPCNETCYNLPGSYKCSRCPKGYEGDGYKNGTGCVRTPSTGKVSTIALGISISITALLLACACLYWGLQKRKLIQMRKKHFKENGGLTLQHILSQHETEIDSFKIFTAEELGKATNNYDEGRILGRGGQGTVYKGELPDTTVVAIKKSNAIDTSQVQQFVNEVVVLSQINHRNVVRLLGCCLETEVPMLVYEFITNKTLFDHIQKDHTPQMPWHTRIRIAADIAGAISYLHSAASIPIIHRDIKTTNILLDESYTAKVSDFGTSKFAPADRTSVTTLVQGTLGYLDPEYLCSSHLTEKSDVFSFGVVLVELLTGEKAFNFSRKDEERNLATYFVLSLKEDRLLEIVDENLTRQVSERQLHEVAVIAARCLNVKGEDRPSMKEVAIELERMSKRETHPWVEVNVNVDQETAVLLRGPLRSHSGSSQMTNLSVGR